MSWEKVKLGDIAEFSNGVNFDKSSYAPGVKLISVSNFGNRFYPDYSELSEISADAVRKNDYLQHGDIVFVRSNGNKELVGRCMLIDNPPTPTTFSGFCIRARVKDIERFNPKFLTYHFKHDGFRIAMSGNAVGANIQNLSQGRLSAYVAYIPPIKTQHRIADILSAYDDLIENNRKQIKLLEEAAQRVYKEWFVDLRFPGYEHTRIADGVPEGWEKKQAGAFFDITIGKTPPRAEQKWFTNGKKGVPWVSISDMGNASTFIFDTSEELTADSIERYNIKIVPAETVLLSFKLTVGRVSISGEDMCTNEAIAHFRIADQVTREYVYCYLKNYPYDTLGSTSSISKAINSKIVKAMPFVMPDHAVIDQFSKCCKPFLEQIKAKQKIILNLQKARDRLLPKLMHGEMENIL